MATYAIATLNIHDRERYSAYEAGFMDAFDGFGGKILSVDEQPHTLEGAWEFTRTVIIEFPDRAQADAWYTSDGYQAILPHRLAASSGSVVFVAGLPEAG